MVPADSILEYIPISQNLFCFDSKKREKNDIKMPIYILQQTRYVGLLGKILQNAKRIFMRKS